MCTALRELVEDGRLEGLEQGLERGKREEKQLCYLRALKLPLTPKEARAVAGISEKEARIALQLRELGKI